MTHGQSLGSRVVAGFGWLFRELRRTVFVALVVVGATAGYLYRQGWLHVQLGPPMVTAAPVIAGDDSEAGTGLGVSGRGHAYGIFVSLSEFPDGPNGVERHLTGHAELAQRVADAFVRARIMGRDDGIVLMDERATVEGFHLAVERLKTRLTRDDLFIVYIATHGGENSLEMRDGAMLTEEGLRAELLTVHAGQGLFIAEACFSGSLEEVALGRSESATLWHGLYSTGSGTLTYGEYLSNALIPAIGTVGADDGSATLDDLFVAVQADLDVSTLPLGPVRRAEMRANIAGEGDAVLWRPRRPFVASRE